MSFKIQRILVHYHRWNFSLYFLANFSAVFSIFSLPVNFGFETNSLASQGRVVREYSIGIGSTYEIEGESEGEAIL